MPDPIARAFFSYAHADNERESGRLLRLAKLIENEFALLTGSEIEVFTDVSAISWGDDWRAKIEEALQETTFFIPVLTPTYFLRDECRREMTQFTAAAETLSLRKLLLSIRYIPIPDLHEESVDELKSKAARMEFEAWDQLRLMSRHAPDHRQAVHRLASRLVELTQELELGHTEPSSPAEHTRRSKPAQSAAAEARARPTGRNLHPPLSANSSHEDGDGPMDVMVDAEPAMVAWGAILEQLPGATERFNSKFIEATTRMNAANDLPNAFARKIQIARELAADVEPELLTIEDLSKSYSDSLDRVDAAFRAMYELAQISDKPENAIQLRALDVMVRNLIVSSQEARVGLTAAADAARAAARLSKDLRPVLRRFETAVRNIIDGGTLIDSWGELGSGTTPPAPNP